jgi:hypothetical protein
MEALMRLNLSLAKALPKNLNVRIRDLQSLAHAAYDHYHPRNLKYGHAHPAVNAHENVAGEQGELQNRL